MCPSDRVLRDNNGDRGGRSEQYGRGHNVLYREFHPVLGHDKNTCREWPAGWKVGDMRKARWVDRRNGLATATQGKSDGDESTHGDY